MERQKYPLLKQLCRYEETCAIAENNYDVYHIPLQDEPNRHSHVGTKKNDRIIDIGPTKT